MAKMQFPRIGRQRARTLTDEMPGRNGSEVIAINIALKRGSSEVIAINIALKRGKSG